MKFVRFLFAVHDIQVLVLLLMYNAQAALRRAPRNVFAAVVRQQVTLANGVIPCAGYNSLIDIAARRLVVTSSIGFIRFLCLGYCGRLAVGFVVDDGVGEGSELPVGSLPSTG